VIGIIALFLALIWMLRDVLELASGTIRGTQTEPGDILECSAASLTDIRRDPDASSTALRNPERTEA